MPYNTYMYKLFLPDIQDYPSKKFHEISSRFLHNKQTEMNR